MSKSTSEQEINLQGLVNDSANSRKREKALIDVLKQIRDISGFSNELVKAPVSVFADMATIHQLADSSVPKGEDELEYLRRKVG